MMYSQTIRRIFRNKNKTPPSPHGFSIMERLLSISTLDFKTPQPERIKGLLKSVFSVEHCCTCRQPSHLQVSSWLHWGSLRAVQRWPLLSEPLWYQRRLRVRWKQSRLQVQAGIRGEERNDLLPAKSGPVWASQVNKLVITSYLSQTNKNIW